MSAGLLDLNAAYDDNGYGDAARGGSAHDSPMFTTNGYPRLMDSGRSASPAMGRVWTGSPGHAPLALLGSPGNTYSSGHNALMPADRSRLSSNPGSGLDRALPPSRPSPQPSRPRPPRNESSDSFPVGAKTPYDVLGVLEFATQDEIKKAYKKAALKYHPDLCRGDEAAKATATQRFQLIGEAFAILGDPKRRAEYDVSRRQRSKGTSGSSYSKSSRPSKPPTFKSTFMPNEPSEDDLFSRPNHTRFDGGPDMDLRDIDPFYLFTKMFGDPMQFFSSDHRRDRGAPERSSTREIYETHSSPFEMGGFSQNPLMAAAFGRGQGSNTPQRSFKVEENHSSAHMSRHGKLNVSQSQKSLKIHKSGGFTFESRSFSGSLGNGNVDMISALMGGLEGANGMNAIGSGFGGSSGLRRGPDSSFGGLPETHDTGRPRLGRRQSLGALEASMSPAIGRAGGTSLQRRPSLNFDDPFALPEHSASPGNMQLGLFGPSSDSLTPARGWNNGW